MLKIGPSLLRAYSKLTDFAWPPHCILCGQRGQGSSCDLCAGCEADLPNNVQCCGLCAQPFQGENASARLCGACLQRRPRFDGSIIPFRYAYPMDHMIRRLKYGGAIAMGRVLGELFARRATQLRAGSQPQLLVPVPLARGRFCERGYNQAIVLAEHIHRSLALPMRTDLLVRTRETLEQAGLDQRTRRKNIRRAFEVTSPLAVSRIAIIDDVVTTGSTTNEIARVLKRAGAQQVDVWAIARAVRSRQE